MTLEQIIEGLETLKQFFMEESSGCYPLSLEEAQKEIKQLMEEQQK